MENFLDILTPVLSAAASAAAVWVTARWPAIKAKVTKSETKVDDVLVAVVEAALTKIADKNAKAGD